LGVSKVIKKFQRLLAECEEEYVYQGKILEFIKVDYIPEDRHSTGMILTGSTGTSRINFSSGHQKYFENASPFKIGDDVVVFGKKNQYGPTSIIPSIILIPEDETVVFSREQESIRSETWAENIQIVSIILSAILSVLSWLSNDIPLILFNTLFMYMELTLWFALGSILFFSLFIVTAIYDRHSRRERVVRCDTDTWNIINKEILKRFEEGIAPSV
jgi:hypothetical protein